MSLSRYYALTSNFFCHELKLTIFWFVILITVKLVFTSFIDCYLTWFVEINKLGNPKL
jgi:hypothetical protein